MNETHNIKIGNRIFQLEAICRVEYAKNKETKELMNTRSYLHVFTLDGKDFILFNETADILWEALCDSALTLG